jgi:aminoglycoside phosphotransferase (APT) family kinase protein
LSDVFRREIDGWPSWGAVYQALPDFTPLIFRIFDREKLPAPRCLGHLTPGTNAVFRADNLVVKIYAPAESGMDTHPDFLNELFGMKRAAELGLSVPALLAASEIQDTYLFCYLIMEFVDAPEAKSVLQASSTTEKAAFVRRLKAALSLLNTPAELPMPPADLRLRTLQSPRWNRFSGDIRRQLEHELHPLRPGDSVFVHKDLTGDNVLLRPDGSLCFLDFADAVLGPKTLEYPPILFDLFDFDPVLIRAFAADTPPEEFADDVYQSVLLHDFGADSAALICRHLLAVEPAELDDLRKLRSAVHKLLA